MQKFWWPGYEMQLVGELQRQQNSSQFCDTLLQTEGISVPTHSCVLAALSPYLCQRLSASPSPPSGQKRQLQLQTVTAQTLLKLVSLLYSGELEVRGSKEQNDVLAAAHQLGIGHLVLGYKDGWVKDGELLYRGQSVGKHMDNLIHAEETRQRHRGLKTQDAQVQTEMNGKRENDPHVKMKSFVSVATQTVKAGVTSFSSVPPDQTLECPSSAAASPISLQPQSIAPKEQLGLFSCPAVHRESTVGRSSISEKNTTSSSTSSTSLSDDTTSPRFQEENISKQLSEAGGVTVVLNDNKTRQENRKTNPRMTDDGGHDAERQRQVCRDENTPEEERNSAGMRSMGGKSLENMKRMETTQISVKMKLRRTTEEKAWRVVTKDEDKTPFLLTSEKQGGSNLKTPQMDQTSASSVLPVQNPENPHLHPVIATSPQPPEHGGRNSEPLSHLTPNHGRELESEVLPQPQGSVDEPDEDIDRMLDEIMMGLNILPNLNNTCRTAQTSHDGGQNFCQVPDSSAGSTHMQAGYDFYQNLRIPANAAKFCDSVAEVASVYPQTTGSILPSTCVLREPKLNLPGLQPLSSQEDRSVLHFLPLSREDEPEPEQTFSLAFLNELRLPRPISPLEPCSPEAEQQPRPNKSFVNPEKDQQSFLRRPWFTEAPWSLHFPLYALTEAESKPALRGSSTGCGSEQLCVGWKPNNGKTCAETVGGVKERGNESQPGEKSDPKKMKKRKQVATGDAAAPKKRRRRCKIVELDSLDQYLDSKIPTCCSVSLSSNNMLAIERKMATNPSNRAWMSLDKTKQKATIQTSAEEKNRMVENLSKRQTPIRTRSFVKRSEEKKSDKIPKKSVLIPAICKTEAKEKQGTVVPKRKRGRPRKNKLDPPPPCNAPEDRNCNETSEQQALPKLEAKDGAKKRRRKVRKNTSEAEKTKGAESAGTAEENGDAKDPETRKHSLMATLKEFQKFIKRQRKKSTESQETNEPVGEEKRDMPSGSNSEAEVEIKESMKIQDPDKNHNYLFTSAAARCNKPHHDEANCSTRQKTSFNEDHLSSEDVLVDLMEPSSDPQQLLKNPAEGASCWTGASEAAQSVISDDSASHCDDKLPRDTNNVLSQRTGSPPSGADGPRVTPSHCEREEEDEEEVDVLLFSPEKGLPVGAREEGPKSIAILSADDDEEEDVNEIDVTGDEEE